MSSAWDSSFEQMVLPSDFWVPKIIFCTSDHFRSFPKFQPTSVPENYTLANFLLQPNEQSIRTKTTEIIFFSKKCASTSNHTRQNFPPSIKRYTLYGCRKCISPIEQRCVNTIFLSTKLESFDYTNDSAQKMWLFVNKQVDENILVLKMEMSSSYGPFNHRDNASTF